MWHWACQGESLERWTRTVVFRATAMSAGASSVPCHSISSELSHPTSASSAAKRQPRTECFNEDIRSCSKKSRSPTFWARCECWKPTRRRTFRRFSGDCRSCEKGPDSWICCLVRIRPGKMLCSKCNRFLEAKLQLWLNLPIVGQGSPRRIKTRKRRSTI